MIIDVTDKYFEPVDDNKEASEEEIQEALDLIALEDSIDADADDYTDALLADYK